MLRANDLNLENYPVRIEMTGAKNILISHVCYIEDTELKYFPAEKNL